MDAVTNRLIYRGADSTPLRIFYPSREQTKGQRQGSEAGHPTLRCKRVQAHSGAVAGTARPRGVCYTRVDLGVSEAGRSVPPPAYVPPQPAPTAHGASPTAVSHWTLAPQKARPDPHLQTRLPGLRSAQPPLWQLPSSPRARGLPACSSRRGWHPQGGPALSGNSQPPPLRFPVTPVTVMSERRQASITRGGRQDVHPGCTSRMYTHAAFLVYMQEEGLVPEPP